MAPSTRSTVRPSTPPNRIEVCEATTRKRTRFFEAYDTRHEHESLRSIAADKSIPKSTASRWLHEREQIGSPAYRRSCRRSEILGRRSKVSKDIYKMLVSPSKNKVRDQPYEAQIEFHHLPIKKRALQKGLKKHTNGGQMFKHAFVRKTLSAKNRRERTRYGQEHIGKTVDDFWQYIFFTDEAHIDPSSTAQGYILRERGTRYDTQNIQQRGEKTGVVLHVAAWCNWYKKAEKLEFYNDENDCIQRPKRPPKPRKTMYESTEEFQRRLEEWDASLPHEQEIE
jgi:hypothetical protein